MARRNPHLDPQPSVGRGQEGPIQSLLSDSGSPPRPLPRLPGATSQIKSLCPDPRVGSLLEEPELGQTLLSSHQ